MGESNQLTREQKLSRDFEELLSVGQMIKNPLFQKYFMVPMVEERTKVKNAYDCEALKDLYFQKGKKNGLQTFFDIPDKINQDAKFIKKRLDDLERGA